MAEKSYIADKYLSKITHRVARPSEVANQIHATVHKTWQEAHASLVADRQAKVKRAQEALDKAQRTLDRAMAMKPNE